MKYELGKKTIEAIEKGINAPGSPVVEVRIANGRVEVFQTTSKRLTPHYDNKK